MKIVKIAIIMVLGSVEYEHIFSMLAFMKNRLITRMLAIVSMHSQSFFTLENFP
jgi:hypothetical protein